MKRRKALMIASAIVVLGVLMSLGGRVVGFSRQPTAAQCSLEEPLPDLSTLLDFPCDVHIEELVGTERDTVLGRLMERAETGELIAAMGHKGFYFDRTAAEVMRVVITGETPPYKATLEAMAMSTQADGLSAALTAMVADDGTGFFQAHHTNLDPTLAEVSDPPIIVNDMPYFYITTLRYIDGRIIYWRYWWYDSHHHPNWYYSHYYWYWRYYRWYYVPWPYWYWWADGWYYWRYWHYWSTWFPW